MGVEVWELGSLRPTLYGNSHAVASGHYLASEAAFWSAMGPGRVETFGIRADPEQLQPSVGSLGPSAERGNDSINVCGGFARHLFRFASKRMLDRIWNSDRDML